MLRQIMHFVLPTEYSRQASNRGSRRLAAATLRRFGLFGLTALVVATGCGTDNTPIVNSKPVDVIEGIDGDNLGTDGVATGTDAVDWDQFNSTDDAGSDGTGTETKQLNCPGTAGDPGCPCTSVQQCASNFCIDTPAGQQCAALCTDTCEPGFKCMTSNGVDPSNVCVPQYGKICDPCTTNQDCTGIGNATARCVDQGDNGAFCGNSCTADGDCPDSYECKDVKDTTGAPSKQCVVKAGGSCSCSDSAMKLQLSTKCYAVSGANKCEGKRTCQAAGTPGAPENGGLSTCIAPKPADESCNGVDDNCNGQTDENTCDDKNGCSDDSCTGAAGCKNVFNTAVCDDGSVCTTNDVCKDGKCLPGAAQDCDDKNPCTADTCDLAKGCTHTNADGVTCDADNNACTTSDTCLAGKCLPGEVKACASPEPCLLGKCAIDTGVCGYTFQVGNPCNDGNACTTSETCVIDTCKGDQVKCDDANPCTGDSCDPKSGCLHKPTSGGCDDGNACTSGDTCDDKGGCIGAALDVSATCDDFNTCTTDTCDPKKGCVHKNSDGIACDDNNACTINDACKAGVCASTTNTCDCATDVDCAGKGDGNPCKGTLFCDTAKLPYQCVIKASTIVKCDDSLNGVCQNNACDPTSGKCKLLKKPEGLACDADKSLCTVGDACKDGACTPGQTQQCDDKNACTDDSCDPLLGCKYTPNSNPCDADSNACTENDACALGTCVAGKSKLCASDDQCVEGKCSIATGKCGYLFKDNFPCNDGSSCTLGDKCAVDKCSGTTANCDDNNPCTGDSCDAKDGCLHVNVTGSCTDSDACTDADQCVAGACKGTPVDAKKCDDSNVCTSDSCEPATGCAHASANGPCDDGNPCTNGDSCLTGKCLPGSNSCACNQDSDCKDDGNLCNGVQLCDKSKLPYACVLNPASVVKCDASVNGQCQTNDCVPGSGSCVLNKQPDTLACDADGNACTLGDACLDGKCTPGKVQACDDKNSCTDDSCDVKKGCVYVPNTAPCDADSNACTQNDICQTGSCVAGKLKVCDDGESCTGDSCDIANGTCKYAPLPSKSCSDDNICTSGDMCGNNASTGTYTCVPGKAVVCEDSNPCTTDACDTIKGCSNVVDATVKVACYTGPAGTKGIGLCSAGTQQCGLDGQLGTCLNQVLPAVKELCNAVDDTCDGVVDEGCKPVAFLAKMANVAAAGTGTKYTLRTSLGGSSVIGATTVVGKYNVSLGFMQMIKKFMGL